MFQAILYKDSVVVNRIEAYSIDVLKSKCEPFLSNDKITSIKIVKLTDVGYMKLPEWLSNIVEDKLIK